MLNYSDLLLIIYLFIFFYLFIHLFVYNFYLFIYSKSLIPVRRQRRFNVKCICLRHETVLLFSMSCDWETVKNVVPGNSSMKPDQTDGDGKGMKQYTTISISSSWVIKQLFQIFLCNSQNYNPQGAVDEQMNCCPRPKAEGNSSLGHPQHWVIHSTEKMNETFNCERKMQNGANLLRSLIKQRSSRLFVYNFCIVSL